MESSQTQSFPGPIEMVQRAYATFRSIYKVVIPVLLVSFLASSFQLIVAFTSNNASFVYLFATLLSFILVSLSYLAVVIAIATPAPENAAPFTLYQKAWTLFYAYIIVFILMSVSMLAGGLLLVVPGIIIGVFLCLSPYVLVKEHKKGIQALVKSWYYVQDNWWRVLGRVVVFFLFVGFLLILLSLLISITGLNDVGPMTTMTTQDGARQISLIESILNQAFQAFIVTPLSVSFFYALYTALRHKKSEEPDELHQKHVRNILYGALIGGGIVMIVLAILMVVFAGDVLPFMFPPERIPLTNTFLS